MPLVGYAYVVTVYAHACLQLQLSYEEIKTFLSWAILWGWLNKMITIAEFGAIHHNSS